METLAPQKADFLQNSKKLFERFPDLAVEMMATSSEPWVCPIEEEGEVQRWRDSLDLKNKDLVLLLGIGSGERYFALREWLHEDPKRHLVVFEIDPKILKSFFSCERASTLLEDCQVRIYSIENQCYRAQLMEHLASYYVFSSFEFTSSEYCKNSADTIRDQFFTCLTARAGLCNEFVNNQGERFAWNLYNNIPHLKQTHDARGFFQNFKNMPALICCGGPSLEEQLPHLARWQDKALIFSGGSATNALHLHGQRPHLVYGIDPNIEEYRRHFYNTFFEVPLCFNLRVHPQVLNVHTGPRMYLSHFIVWSLMAWWEKKVGIHPNPYSGGLFSSTMCMDFARMMGCNPIIFLGMDFSYRTLEGTLGNTRDLKDNILKQKCMRKGVDGKPITSNWEWVLGARWLDDYAKAFPQTQFINVGTHSLPMQHIQQASIETIEAKYLKSQKDTAGIFHATLQGTHLLEYDALNMNAYREGLLDSFKSCRILLRELHSINAEKAQETLKQELAYQIALQPLERLFRECQAREYDTIHHNKNMGYRERIQAHDKCQQKLLEFMHSIITYHEKCLTLSI